MTMKRFEMIMRKQETFKKMTLSRLDANIKRNKMNTNET